ncbi:MAG: CAP domain-containing protein, partial [Alkalibacterium sp.]
MVLVLTLGFWLGASGILNGTRAGSWMNTAVDYFPTRTELQQLRSSFDSVPFIGDTSLMRKQGAQEEKNNTILESNTHTDVDYDTVEQTIVTLVNELREELGLDPVASNDMLKAAAIIRAVETEESFSHTRPDGSSAFTVFEEDGIAYPYKVVGENLGMA